MNKPSRGLQILIHAVLLLGVAVTLYPVLWVFKMAFTSSQGFSSGVGLIPDEPSLDNFRYLFTEVPFVQWFINSLIIAAFTTVIGILLSCTAAYAFSRFRFPGQQAGLLSFLVTQMFPGVMMMIPLYLIVSTLGLLDTIWGLVLVYSTTSLPFCVWMLKGYFDTIPKELEESALMDGASRGVIFWRIIMPLARPAVAVTALFSFMTAWNEFVLAATFMNKEEMYTLPVGLRMFVGQFASEWGYFSAGAILASIPVVALFFYLQENLVGGLTAGSVKG